MVVPPGIAVDWTEAGAAKELAAVGSGAAGGGIASAARGGGPDAAGAGVAAGSGDGREGCGWPAGIV